MIFYGTIFRHRNDDDKVTFTVWVPDLNLELPINETIMDLEEPGSYLPETFNEAYDNYRKAHNGARPVATPIVAIMHKAKQRLIVRGENPSNLLTFKSFIVQR